MAEFKLVISDKGKAVQKEIKDEQAEALINKIIGDKVSGDSIGFSGYEFQITGGSDKSGFPMRRDVIGKMRKKILATDSLGVHIEREGIRKRKTVAGNAVYDGTSQINLKVIKQGKEQLIASAEKEQPASKEAEKPAEPEKQEKPAKAKPKKE
jgi:small subunit ribosomal protein S6e